MTEPDYTAFVAEFDRLHAALAGFRATPDEQRAKADAYFHALKHLPLASVTAKADAWLQRESKMPKPVEWASITVDKGQVVPALNPRDGRDYLKAEGLGYEGEPCVCAECLQAGVSDKPLRFVPEFLADGRADWAAIGARLVTRGHWAHGRELAGYYRAKGDFWNKFYELYGARAFPSDVPRHGRTVVDFRQVTR